MGKQASRCVSHRVRLASTHQQSRRQRAETPLFPAVCLCRTGACKWQRVGTNGCCSSISSATNGFLIARPGFSCATIDENLFSTLLTELPVVSTFAGTGPTFPRIALETVTMVRYDLSIVVTDQKHDEQFFHEGSYV